MRTLFRAHDRLGNQEPLPAVFPDGEAPIVRIDGNGERELVRARWGWDRTRRGWITNARNLDRSWNVIGNPRHRCLVPATAFAEYHPEATIPGTRGRPVKAAAWFRLAGGTQERPPFAFPGFWRQWDWKSGGLRRKSDAELARTNARLLAMVFLTCAANNVVRPVHPSAMPVVLHTQEDWETWLVGSADEAAELQRPLPDSHLEIAFIGGKEDSAGA